MVLPPDGLPAGHPVRHGHRADPAHRRRLLERDHLRHPARRGRRGRRRATGPAPAAHGPGPVPDLRPRHAGGGAVARGRPRRAGSRPGHARARRALAGGAVPADAPGRWPQHRRGRRRRRVGHLRPARPPACPGDGLPRRRGPHPPDPVAGPTGRHPAPGARHHVGRRGGLVERPHHLGLRRGTARCPHGRLRLVPPPPAHRHSPGLGAVGRCPVGQRDLPRRLHPGGGAGLGDGLDRPGRARPGAGTPPSRP